MKGIIVRELRLFLTAPINLGLTFLTPILYGFLFSVSMSSAVPTISYESTAVSYLKYVAPGLATFAILMFANMSGPAVFQEKASGMLREIASCPINAIEYVLGKLACGSAIAALQGMVILMVFGSYAGITFEIPVLCKLVGLMFLGAIGLVATYNSIWGLIKNGQSASLLCSILTTVLTFTSPVFYTVENMPEPLQVLAAANPMTYIVGFLRYVTLKTSSCPSPWIGLIALAGVVSLDVFSIKRAMSNL